MLAHLFEGDEVPDVRYAPPSKRRHVAGSPRNNSGRATEPSLLEVCLERHRRYSTWRPPSWALGLQPTSEELRHHHITLAATEDHSINQSSLLMPLGSWAAMKIPKGLAGPLSAPSAIQAYALPYILYGHHDVVRVISPSGTGKSLLALMAAALILKEEDTWCPCARHDDAPYVLYFTSILHITAARNTLAAMGSALHLAPAVVETGVRFVTRVKGKECRLGTTAPALRLVVFDDVAVAREDIEDAVRTMPPHCMVVLLSQCERPAVFAGPEVRQRNSITITLTVE